MSLEGIVANEMVFNAGCDKLLNGLKEEGHYLLLAKKSSKTPKPIFNKYTEQFTISDESVSFGDKHVVYWVLKGGSDIINHLHNSFRKHEGLYWVALKEKPKQINQPSAPTKASAQNDPSAQTPLLKTPTQSETFASKTTVMYTQDPYEAGQKPPRSLGTDLIAEAKTRGEGVYFGIHDLSINLESIPEDCDAEIVKFNFRGNPDSYIMFRGKDESDLKKKLLDFKVKTKVTYEPLLKSAVKNKDGKINIISATDLISRG